MELSKLTFDTVRGRVDTKEGWWEVSCKTTLQHQVCSCPFERVEIEAVFSKAVQEIAWRDLQDDRVWRQGWV